MTPSTLCVWACALATAAGRASAEGELARVAWLAGCRHADGGGPGSGGAPMWPLEDVRLEGSAPTLGR